MPPALTTTKTRHNKSSWSSFEIFGKTMSKNDYMMLPRISKGNLPSQDMLDSKHAPLSLKTHAAQQNKNPYNNNAQWLVPKNEIMSAKQEIPESTKAVSEAVTVNMNPGQETVEESIVNTSDTRDSSDMIDRALSIHRKTEKSM